MTRVVASIEARMGASRLPGKVMKRLVDRPAIALMAQRVRQAERLDDIVIATSTNARDDVIADWAECAGFKCYRGSEDDVLGRVAAAHRALKSDIVVELCGDCPLIDPDVIDRSVERYLAGDAELVTTSRSPSYPQGLDVEVFSLDVLQSVEKTVDDAEVREHVSLDFYRRPDRYKVADIEAPPQLHRPEIRLLLDYPEDLEFLRAVCSRLMPEHGIAFDTKAIIELLDREPALMAINKERSEFAAVR